MFFRVHDTKERSDCHRVHTILPRNDQDFHDRPVKYIKFYGVHGTEVFLGVHGTEEESDCSQGHTAPPGNPQASHDSPVSLGDEMFQTDPETRPELLGRAWQRVIRRD